MSQPSREVRLHRSVERTITDMGTPDRERLTDLLTDVSEQREPSSHSKVAHLHGNNSGLLRLRSGEWRATLEIVGDELRVLRLNKRSQAYDENYDDQLQKRRAD